MKLFKQNLIIEFALILWFKLYATQKSSLVIETIRSNIPAGDIMINLLSQGGKTIISASDIDPLLDPARLELTVSSISEVDSKKSIVDGREFPIATRGFQKAVYDVPIFSTECIQTSISTDVIHPTTNLNVGKFSINLAIPNKGINITSGEGETFEKVPVGIGELIFSIKLSQWKQYMLPNGVNGSSGLIIKMMVYGANYAVKAPVQGGIGSRRKALEFGNALITFMANTIIKVTSSTAYQLPTSDLISYAPQYSYVEHKHSNLYRWTEINLYLPFQKNEISYSVYNIAVAYNDSSYLLINLQQCSYFIITIIMAIIINHILV